ncbi:MAG TPA: NADH:ubiquinone reductase (Na(+)-transporting) subunit B [Planctomycetota bacterium]|nr:NADH:ubiquinone reductase (Na(+)-transporting) subunit B [Planctomycetota bacterium]HJM38644.1 NADH:ubiquinone reductase (Na(+)-transporting) subunit B [Planctomycetota bacterium]
MFDKIAPFFEKGGKFEKFYPLFEAGESFLYTPAKATQTGPHVRDGLDLKRAMMTVVIALVPATLWSFYNAGFQAQIAAGTAPDSVECLAATLQGLLIFLPIYIVTMAAGGLIETVFALVRKHEINEGFLVTSLLFPLIVPPSIPLWQVALGIGFGTLIGKEIFGGTGMNILNPALTGRAFLFFAYPGQISGDEVWIAGKDQWVDGFSGATPLAEFYNDGAGALANLDWMDAFLGRIPGSMGEVSALACLIGAAILIFSKVGSWRIMAGSLLGLVGMSLLLNAFSPTPEHYMAIPWHWHFVVGGFAFGAIFMATDPVSASQTNRGKWIYGIFIGLLCVLVRVLNPAYPEGMMLAILFMNIFAPVIDYYVVKANIKQREARCGVQ